MDFINFVIETSKETIRKPVGPLHGTFHTSLPEGYVQLFNSLPSLKALYPFEYENNWSEATYHQSIFHKALTEGHLLMILGAYIAFLVIGTAVMSSRKPLNLKYTWRCWNLALSLFSLAGFLRTMPHLIMEYSEHGFHYTLCGVAEDRYGLGAAGFWTMLFIWSKLPELVDTIFVVLCKKPLLFLHYYHHITVLAYCWHSYAFANPSGLWFVAMNFGVHALMYGYYFLRNCGFKLRWLAPIVTLLQTSQMVVGVVVCGGVYYYKRVLDLGCNVDNRCWLAGLVMYASYFVLFALLGINRYCTSGGESTRKRIFEKKKTQ